ncbi:hypothetical protein MRX96_038474 [Rhipicephalus microplus]
MCATCAPPRRLSQRRLAWSSPLHLRFRGIVTHLVVFARHRRAALVVEGLSDLVPGSGNLTGGRCVATASLVISKSCPAGLAGHALRVLRGQLNADERSECTGTPKRQSVSRRASSSRSKKERGGAGPLSGTKMDRKFQSGICVKWNICQGKPL